MVLQAYRVFRRVTEPSTPFATGRRFARAGHQAPEGQDPHPLNAKAPKILNLNGLAFKASPDPNPL